MLAGFVMLLLGEPASAISKHTRGASNAALMRHEASFLQEGHDKATVSVSPIGDAVNHPVHIYDDIGSNASIENASDLVRANSTLKDIDICNDDFPLGLNNSNDCSNTDPRDRIILDSGMCMIAAAKANAGIERNFFVIPEDYADVHPMGCFSWHCGHTHGRTGTGYSECYFYNPTGSTPVDPKGHPVCFRPEYLNGTKNSNGGCETDWENIMDEDHCRAAAACLNYDDTGVFRIGTYNWSKHDEYPKGCFIRNDNGKMQFNNISSLNRDPARPEGIPVCRVAKGVHWGSGIYGPNFD